jgi:hypothetical protein
VRHAIRTEKLAAVAGQSGCVTESGAQATSSAMAAKTTTFSNRQTGFSDNHQLLKDAALWQRKRLRAAAPTVKEKSQ